MSYKVSRSRDRAQRVYADIGLARSVGLWNSVYTLSTHRFFGRPKGFYLYEVNPTSERSVADAILDAVSPIINIDEGDEIDGHPVSEVQTLDGFKHVTDNGWLLIRPSGTEPVLRVYSEAESPDAAEALVKDASRQLGLEE